MVEPSEGALSRVSNRMAARKPPAERKPGGLSGFMAKAKAARAAGPAAAPKKKSGGFFGKIGKALAAPHKIINKSVRGVGGGVNKAVRKTGGMVHKAVKAPF